MHFKLKVSYLVALSLILLLAVSAGAITLEEVQKAIKDKGANWTAGETSISKVAPELRAGMFGEINASFVPGPGDVVIDYADPSIKGSFDWRSQGGQNWLTSVKQQGYCGACTAFASVGALEATINIVSNDPSLDRNLSEQHLFSCGGGTCSGGMYPDDAMSYLYYNGTPDENCFPYTAGDSGQDQSCSKTCSGWQARATKITGNDWYYTQNAIKTAINSAPLITTMIIYEDFYYYNGDVYEHVYGAYEGGHAVLLVGYNDTGGYWIVKNSWSTGWGESGYFKIKYGECDIADYAARVYANPQQGDDDDDDTTDDDDDDNDDNQRDCNDICDKLIACGHYTDNNLCLSDCPKFRSEIATCLERANDCSDVHQCMGLNPEEELCEKICNKLFECDYFSGDQAESCMDYCMNDMSSDLQECLDDANVCGEVDFCTGETKSDSEEDDSDDSNSCGSIF